MSDVSKTNELIAELRKAQDAAGFIPHGTMDHETQWLPFANLYNAAEALLEDLEAATCVPVQGEPNDDREVLKRIAEEASVQRLKDSIEEWRKAIGAAYGTFPDDWELEFWHAGYKHGANAMIEHQVSRAAVPDAATDAREHLHAKCNCVPDLGPAHCHLCGRAKGSPVPWNECEAVEWACKTCDGIGLIGSNYMNSSECPDCEPRAQRRRAEAERDAALAAVERDRLHDAVNAIPNHVWDAMNEIADTEGFTDALLAALDGAPEPEVKP